MLEDYINKLRPLVLELFFNDYSGHDIGHLERTMKIALLLQQYEGGDKIVIGISAFLHDIHRILQNDTGKFVSPRDSLSKVREILSAINIDEERVNKILHAIEYHEVYNWNSPSNKENDINTLILQDADNLDAIGAIGIGRTFTYGGAHKIPMYDSQVALDNSKNYFEENGDDASTIHHFYHKLFKLANNMNTKKAKELALSRTEFMKGFVDEFLKEWNGEK